MPLEVVCKAPCCDESMLTSTMNAMMMGSSWSRVVKGGFVLALVVVVGLQFKDAYRLSAEENGVGSRKMLTALDEVDPMNAKPGNWGVGTALFARYE